MKLAQQPKRQAQLRIRPQTRHRRAAIHLRLSQLVFATLAVVSAVLVFHGAIEDGFSWERGLMGLILFGGFGAGAIVMGAFATHSHPETVTFTTENRTQGAFVSIEARTGKRLLWREEISSAQADDLLEVVDVPDVRVRVGPLRRSFKPRQMLQLHCPSRSIGWELRDVEGFEDVQRLLHS